MVGFCRIDLSLAVDGHIGPFKIPSFSPSTVVFSIGLKRPIDSHVLLLENGAERVEKSDEVTTLVMCCCSCDQRVRKKGMSLRVI